MFNYMQMLIQWLFLNLQNITFGFPVEASFKRHVFYRQHKLLLSCVNNISVLKTNTSILIFLNKDEGRTLQTKSTIGFQATMYFLLFS